MIRKLEDSKAIKSKSVTKATCGKKRLQSVKSKIKLIHLNSSIKKMIKIRKYATIDEQRFFMTEFLI